MTFAHPTYLLLLLLPVFLFWWTVRNTGTPIRLPFDREAHPKRNWLGLLLRMIETLPSLVLALAIIMLARPQILRVPERDRIATHITICMDVSGSMGAGMGELNRYESAAASIENFTYSREGDAIGLTLFGSWPLRWVPLTKDLQALRNALVFANPRNQPSGMGGTMIGSALKYCADNMQREAARLSGDDDQTLTPNSWREKRAKDQLFRRVSSGGDSLSSQKSDRLLVLVSDGMSGDLNGQEQIDEISGQLNDAAITMYHIHIGSDTIPDAVSSIAEETGGRAFLATNADGLQLIFDHIDQMQPARFVSTASVPVDYFAPFATIALAILLFYLFSLLKWRHTPW